MASSASSRFLILLVIVCALIIVGAITFYVLKRNICDIRSKLKRLAAKFKAYRKSRCCKKICFGYDKSQAESETNSKAGDAESWQETEDVELVILSQRATYPKDI